MVKLGKILNISRQLSIKKLRAFENQTLRMLTGIILKKLLNVNGNRVDRRL